MHLRHPRRVGVLLTAGTLALGGLIALPADAATPASGSISDTSTSTTWTAGPFLVANVTGTAGDVQCTAATPCDDFGLSVSVPSGYDATHQVKVNISWANSAADYDLYVLDQAGNIISSSASSSGTVRSVTCRPKATFSTAVSRGSSLKSWKMTPTLRRSSDTREGRS